MDTLKLKEFDLKILMKHFCVVSQVLSLICALALLNVLDHGLIYVVLKKRKSPTLGTKTVGIWNFIYALSAILMSLYCSYLASIK